MSRLMRRSYGYGGTRLERVIVCPPPMETPPMPLWLKLPALALLLVLPFLIGRYAVPTSNMPMRTVIDISKLTIEPPPPMIFKPERPKPEPVRPPERVAELPPKTETPPPQAIQRVTERSTFSPAPAETQRPTISRNPRSDLAGGGTYRPGIIRERRQVDIGGGGTAAATRIRREVVVGEAPSAGATISRSRSGGANAMDSSLATRDAIVVRRRSAPAGGAYGSGGIGIGTSQGPTVIRRGRPSGPTSGEGGGIRVAATRERSRSGNGSGGGSGEGESSSVGAVRGISLMSLEICSSAQLQEEKTKDVLSVVGSRRSCRDEKGEFQFRGTRRVSSFNLIIFPSQGRKPSNRCKELEYAYNCLTTN